MAAHTGNVLVVDLLIAAQADINAIKAGDDGSTPLYGAAYNGHDPVVKRLITAHADVDKAATG